MKTVYFTLIALLFTTSLFGGIGTPFILTGVKKVYPVVEINTKYVSKELKPQIKELFTKRLTKLGIDSKGYSSRAFAILISRPAVGDSSHLVLKTSLLLGENVTKESGQKVFAITYEVGDIYEPDPDYFEDSVIESVTYLLDMFEEQYLDDNRVKTTKDFSHDMRYETNFRDAIKRANIEKKDIFFVMVTNYCPWCRKLENMTLSTSEVDKYVQKNYIPLVLNREKGAFPKELYKPIVPVVYVLDYKTLKPKKISLGYKTKHDFLKELKR